MLEKFAQMNCVPRTNYYSYDFMMNKPTLITLLSDRGWLYDTSSKIVVLKNEDDSNRETDWASCTKAGCRFPWLFTCCRRAWKRCHEAQILSFSPSVPQ